MVFENHTLSLSLSLSFFLSRNDVYVFFNVSLSVSLCTLQKMNENE